MSGYHIFPFIEHVAAITPAVTAPVVFFRIILLHQELELAKSEYEAKTEELRKQDAFLASLSHRNWTIYKRAFINGESREVIARELEIGSATVSRVIQFLRSHLIAGDTIKRGRKKKIAKK